MSDKIRILIVEDEVLIALEIKKFLEKSDYEIVNIAMDYDEALSSVDRNTPQIILMDINLGKNSKNGIEAIKEIHKKNISQPYILLPTQIKKLYINLHQLIL